MPSVSASSVPFWSLFSRVSRQDNSDEKLLSVYRDYGVVEREGRDDNNNRLGADISKYQLVERGDLVVNKMKAWQGSLGVSQFRGIVSPAYFVYKPHHNADSQYLNYVLRSGPFIDLYAANSKGIRPAQWDLQPERLDQIRVPFPPLETQRAIADYLDRETAEIDAMSADLDEMEALLTERRNAAPTTALTRLNGHPSNRRVGLNVVADLVSSNVDKKSREGENPVRLVNYTDVYYGDVLTAKRDYMEATATPDQIARVGVRDGDVIFTKDSESPDDIGIPALIGDPDPDMVCGYHLTIARPRPHLVTPRFLYWTLMSGQAKAHWEQHANGVTRFSIGTMATAQLPVVLPPLDEQRRIADEIDRATAEIDSMLADITELRDLLAERRAAIIAAAVTGQIDIPIHEEATHA